MTDAADRRGPVREGDVAPDFTLPDQTGTRVTLSGLRGQPVVLYFYPKNGTPVCTAEACGFRDGIGEFRGLGAHVVGVSGDTVESHAAFAGSLGLPFTLLSDRDGAVRRAYGVPSALGLMAGRTTYVIDAAGVVRRVITAHLSARKHVEGALGALRAG